VDESAERDDSIESAEERFKKDLVLDEDEAVALLGTTWRRRTEEEEDE
jgi:hypothetical protein